MFNKYTELVTALSSVTKTVEILTLDAIRDSFKGVIYVRPVSGTIIRHKAQPVQFEIYGIIKCKEKTNTEFNNFFLSVYKALPAFFQETQINFNFDYTILFDAGLDELLIFPMRGFRMTIQLNDTRNLKD